MKRPKLKLPRIRRPHINLRHRWVIAASVSIIFLGGITAAYFISANSTTPVALVQPATVVPIQPAPVQPESVAAPTLTVPEDPVLELFQPSDASLQAQHTDSDMSQQIENAMVVSYTLVRCNLLSQADYTDTYHALVTYATRSHFAPDAVQTEAKVRSIASAAAASYSLVYSNANCSDPALAQKAATLKQWRTAILSSPAP